MSHVSLKLGQFSYFDQQLGHPEWRGKTVLDFGGNSGNLLLAAGEPIRQENYWCIDVSADGIAEGRRRFPHANWILYDRYNISFHPSGSGNAVLPAPECHFDYILAYSVFTHIDVKEMDELIAGLLPMLCAGGVFAFTYIDHNFRSWPHEHPVTNLQWRLERMQIAPQKAAALMTRAASEEYFRLAGDGDLYPRDEAIAEPSRYEGTPYHVFHSTDFMRGHFPKAELLPPANGEMQHCCLLRAS